MWKYRWTQCCDKFAQPKNLTWFTEIIKSLAYPIYISCNLFVESEVTFLLSLFCSFLFTFALFTHKF